MGKTMEIKEWSYEEFPDFTENVPGAERRKTTGDEIGVQLRRDVAYACVNGVSLVLQILEPFTRNNPDGAYPCMVFVQGSAWMEQDVYRPCAMVGRLASLGFVTAVVQYRHSGIAPFPAQIQDALNAIRFLRCHGKKYHVNPEQIFVAGCSSGGHTAMFAGMTQDEGAWEKENCYPGISARVKGIINYYGAVDLADEEGYPSTVNHQMADSPEGRLMGGVNLRENPELARKASVTSWIVPERKIPPVLIIHGTKDRTVSVKQSVRLYRKLKACGQEAELILLEGADHGGAEYWTEDLCRRVADFMRKHLG